MGSNKYDETDSYNPGNHSICHLLYWAIVL